MKKYDAVIIGSGQSGTPLAFKLASKGWKTALVERKNPGGSCVNYGCTPTKTMLASAHNAHLVKRAADFGIEVGEPSIRWEKIRERKESIVKAFRGGIEKGIKETPGLDYIHGQASFSGKKEVRVETEQGEKTLTGKYIIIDTGTQPTIPPIKGIDETPYLTNLDIMDLQTIPDHLLVIGGGYVGLEFGQMFSRFGSRVTILQRNEQLLPREDEDVAGEVRAIMEKEGIAVHLNSQVEKVQKENGTITLTYSNEKGKSEVTGSHLLVAAGRTPSTEELNLKVSGIKTDSQGFIKTNQWLETTCPGVYAIGDVKGGPAFTHISYDDFRFLYANLVEKQNLPLEERLVPYTVFIDPQLGRVGLTEREAQKSGREFLKAKVPMSSVARAREIDETKGLMKAIIDKKTEKILGFTMLGSQGGEVMGAVQIAMLGNIPYTTLRDTPFAHPTFVESLNNLFSSLE